MQLGFIGTGTMGNPMARCLLDFYTGFHAFLEARGYRKRDDARCTCRDGGAHGHLPECRWVKA
jgi:3-hydroxyisobutyrate dehydrogenase-like beta-hydroxyacid dehydrogenase